MRDGQQATSTDRLPWLSLEVGRQCPTIRWIDVRTEAEFAAGHIPGAEHAPLDRIEPARAGGAGRRSITLLPARRAGRARVSSAEGDTAGTIVATADGYEGGCAAGWRKPPMSRSVAWSRRPWRWSNVHEPFSFRLAFRRSRISLTKARWAARGTSISALT